MMTNLKENVMMRKVVVDTNPWLVKCCWSCRHSDVSYNLTHLVCIRLGNNKKMITNLCNLYQANPKNPFK